MSSEINLSAQLRIRRRRPVTSENLTPAPSEGSSSDQVLASDVSTLTTQPSGNLITLVDSLMSFVHYLSAFPDETFEDIFGSFEASAGLLLGEKQVSVLGAGASFEVQAERGDILPDELKHRLPTLLKEKPKAVAIKVPLVQAVVDNKFDRAKEAICLRAIAWECHVLSHPPIRKCENVVDCYAVTWKASFAGEDYGSRLLPALVMELADEGSLNALFNPDVYRLAYRLKWKLAVDIAQGLNVLHQHGIIHGDIKSENILLFYAADGELVAKVTDFGFSIHDYNPDKTITGQFRGLSPPWNAPEASSGKLVPLSQLYQADLYSYGLLVWRMMLECQTPFDLSDTCPEFLGFEQIADATGTKKRMLISELKAEPNDRFLSLVNSNLANRGLNTQQLAMLFNHTLKFNPDSRIETFQELIGFMKNEGSPPIDVVILTKAEEIRLQSGADSSQFDIFGDEFYRKRAFYGLSASKANVLSLSTNSRIPDQIRRQIFEDLKANPTENRSLDIALSYLIGFGVPIDPVTGLKLMTAAAKKGDIRARAIALRLHSAFNVELPTGIPWSDWLSEATLAGSQIAAMDLQKLDRARYLVAIEDYRRKWHGRVSAHMKDFVSLFELDDPVKCEQSVTNQIAEKDSLYQRVSEIECQGWTLLHYAAAYGYTNTVMKLIDMGLEIDKSNVLGETPLLCACRSGRFTVVKALLERGAGATRTDFIGTAPLHYLICFDPEDVQHALDLLINHGADIHTVSIPSGFTHSPVQFICESVSYSGTPLHWAVQANRRDVAKALLIHGADPLRTDGLEEALGRLDLEIEIDPPRTTAVHSAVANAQADILDLFFAQNTVKCAILLPGPQKIGPRRVSSTLPLQLMCIHGAYYKANFHRTVSLVRDYEEPLIDLLGLAALSNSLLLAEYALDQGCDVNGLIPRAELTPVQLACVKHNDRIALFLLQHGADPKLRSPNLQTSCLTLLALRPPDTNTFGLVQELFKAGITYENSAGSYQAMYNRAVKESRFDIARYLLSVPGCDKDTMERDLLWDLLFENGQASQAPLEFLLAPHHDHDRIAFMASSKLGVTAFHRLAMVGEEARNDDLNHRLVHYLLAIFSSPELLNMLTNLGDTAISLAARNGNHYFVSAMLAAGADPALGKPSAITLVIDRIVLRTVEGGPFRGVAKRFAKARREDDNSARMVTSLLNHHMRMERPEKGERGVRDAKRLMPEWSSTEYAEKCIVKALSASLGTPVVVKLDKGLYIDDGKGSGFRKGGPGDMSICIDGIREDMVRTWMSDI